MGKPSWIDSSIVVSKDPGSGKVISRFADDYWDLTVYRQKQRGPCKIDFLGWHEDAEAYRQLILEMKVIFFLLLTESTGGRQSILTVTTVCHSYQSVVKRIAFYCVENSIHFDEFLNKPTHIKGFASKANLKSHTTLASLLRILIELGPQKTGFNVLDGAHIKQLRASRRRQKKPKQTEFIPERLLGVFFDRWNADIGLFNTNWRNVNLFLNTVFRCPGSGLTVAHQRDLHQLSSKDRWPDFGELSRSYDLTEYFDVYGITNIKLLCSHFAYIQSIGKSMIHLFSGMRSDEAMSLKSNSLKQFNRSGEFETWVFSGETTKYTGKAKKVNWITSEDIKPTWKALSSLSKYIAKRECIAKPWPIFISISYLGFIGGRRQDCFGTATTNLWSIDSTKYIDDQVNIRTEDIAILKAIDSLRNWNEPEFRIGNRWPLRSHQFRRTIALLAAQSGIVTIPSLKRQLQHVTQEMTFYYCNGFSRLTTDDRLSEDFIELFRNSSYEAIAYAYIAEFILSDVDLIRVPKLSGRKKGKVKIGGLNDICLEDDRSELIERVKNGEVSYRTTFLGACLKAGPCTDRAFRSLTACTNCASAAIDETKLDRAINNQRKVVKSLPSSDIALLEEKRQLNDLIEFQKKGDYDMSDEKLKDYYTALERIVNNKPLVVEVGSRITLKSVALEAGKSAGAIKKSRPLYASLVADIKSAETRKNEKKNLHDHKIDRLRTEVQKYKALYEESLAREVVLSSRLIDELSKSEAEINMYQV